MKYDASYHILRVGMAITFLWIGVLILREPVFWSGFIAGWVTDLLPISPVETMYSTAVLDIAVGFFLLINKHTWIASGIASLHLLLVIIVSGIDSIIVRDIGLLTATVALFWISMPMKVKTDIRAKLRPSPGNGA